MADQTDPQKTPAGVLDDETVAALRRRLLSAIRRSCPSWLSSQAEDIAQEALIKVCHILERGGERDRDLPASYLNKVAYTATVDAIRRQRQSSTREVGLDQGAEEAPGLGQMVKARRSAVTLRLQGHSVPEIGTLMGWPQTKANNLVFRGLSDLRRCLEKKGLGP